jgi:AcrR family transcriptional regulator
MGLLLNLEEGLRTPFVSQRTVFYLRTVFVSSTVLGMTKERRTFRAGPIRVRVASTPPAGTPVKERLTVDRIVDTALELMRTRGYEAVSMRAIAKALDTGPASLYAHVASKGQLDQLVVNRICAGIEVPEPDPERWEEQIKELLRSTLAAYRRHPGSARAAMGMIPTEEGALVTAEGMMAICLAGGVPDQLAAWFGDLVALYVGAIAVEESIWAERAAAGEVADSEEEVVEQVRAYFDSLPGDRFPILSSMAGVMTAGSGDDRFEFGLDVLVAGLRSLAARSS